MTDIERRIADIIDKNFEEEEVFFPYTDHRMYMSGPRFNGVIESQGNETDVLFLSHTTNEESDSENLQLFISSPDDMYQDFVCLGDLTEDEQEYITRLFFEEVGTDVVNVK